MTTQIPPTKLLVVVLRGDCHQGLLQKLLDAEFHVTEFSSTGGFLRRNSTTLVIGVAQERVEDALRIIRTQCPTPSDSDEHAATIFVLKARQFVAL